MAKLVRWDPFGEMWTLQREMDRLFEDAFVRPRSQISNGSGNRGGGLALDMYETDEDLVVMASVPGVRPEDIDVTVQDDVLTIKGETQTEQKGDDHQSSYHLNERRYGRFYRQIALPKSVKTDAAEAHFENGVLRLRLPKAEEAKARKIKVQTGELTPQIAEQSAA